MKILYLDCSMGAAGDMLAAALLELLPEPDAFLRELNALGLPGLRLSRELSASGGIRGSRLSVRFDGEEEGRSQPRLHRGLGDVYALLDSLPLSGAVRQHARAVYRSIAEAEGTVHGETPEQVHFHELGALDALFDVAAVSMLIERLAPDRIAASPIHVGSGTVRCAHGVLPVPAPAAAELLRGLPIYATELQGELCTPTGAALLRHFVRDFGPLPPMTLLKTGHGLGSREYDRPNCLRACWGEDGEALRDRVAELRCHLDDMTPEALAFACGELERAGALDVSLCPLQMKKNRAGQLLTVLCPPEEADRLAGEILRLTTAIGLRRQDCQRYILSRSVREEETSLGPIRFKESRGWGAERRKPEYEDVAAAARRLGLSYGEALERLEGRGNPGGCDSPESIE